MQRVGSIAPVRDRFDHETVRIRSDERRAMHDAVFVQSRRDAARIKAMRTATRILTLGYGLALALAASAAESPIWVVLGSYQNAANAEAARQESGMGVLEPLQVRAFDTSAGRWHRLLLGPFEARSQAAAKLAEARSNGHADAWLLAGDGGEVPPGVAASGSANDTALFAGFGDDDEIDDGERFDLYSEFGDFEDYPMPPQADAHLLSEQQERPVSEPPPGYQLHKLRRGGN